MVPAQRLLSCRLTRKTPRSPEVPLDSPTLMPCGSVGAKSRLALGCQALGQRMGAGNAIAVEVVKMLADLRFVEQGQCL